MTPAEAASIFRKLQVKPGKRLAVLEAPREYEEALKHVPAGVETATELRGSFDIIHVFATRKKTIVAEAPKLAKALNDRGILWISYPKGKALETDLNRDILREALEPLGLIGVSIVAIDELWSALRFKYVKA